ncbi:hypothetical protein [Chitinimonas sp. BJYL2]|uniref:hypothetical protein n=1 Tax=Chitinimonas sp. BJYL2 TaxID=2976696 RepID=UPI0022B5C255|nr:hypothetical protein [Chitinimonas sp. BJYL2]
MKRQRLALPNLVWRRPLSAWLVVWRRQAGMPGIVAVLLLLVVGLFQLTQLGPLSRSLSEEKMRLATRAKQLAQMPSAPVAGPADAAQLEQPRLPARGELPAVIRQLDEVFERFGVPASQRDFQPAEEAGGKLVRYTSQLALQRPYPAVRELMVELARLPGVRVESINLSRTQINESAPSALIRYSVLTEVR